MITADKNIDATGRKGIDIKYKGSGPDRRWLIGNGELFYKLHNGAKDGRYVDVMGKIGVELEKRRNWTIQQLQQLHPFAHAQVELTDEEFCNVFIRDGTLAARYPEIVLALGRKSIDVCGGDNSHMMTTLPRPSHVSAPAFEPDGNIMLETDFSGKFAKGLGR